MYLMNYIGKYSIGAFLRISGKGNASRCTRLFIYYNHLLIIFFYKYNHRFNIKQIGFRKYSKNLGNKYFFFRKSRHLYIWQPWLVNIVAVML